MLGGWDLYDTRFFAHVFAKWLELYGAALAQHLIAAYTGSG